MNGISVCPSVCLSVCPSVIPFSLCSYYQIIMKFSGVTANDKGMVHAKGQDQKSKVKVTEVKSQLNRFWTVTPVRVHWLLWNVAQSLKQHRIGDLLFFKVIQQISRSHGLKKNVNFDPNCKFPDCNSSLNSPMATKWYTKLEIAFKRCPIALYGQLSNFKVTWLKNCQFWPKLWISRL